MDPFLAEKTIEVVLVASGLLFTGLLAAALFHWIDQEWRSLDARDHRKRDAITPADTRDKVDESRPGQFPGP